MDDIIIHIRPLKRPNLCVNRMDNRALWALVFLLLTRIIKARRALIVVVYRRIIRPRRGLIILLLIGTIRPFGPCSAY